MEQSNVQTAGPGSIEELGVAPTPLLDGATEYEVITLFNPLPVDFIGMVGQTKPVNMPFEVRKDGVTQTISHDENAVRQNYGLNLKNPDHPSKMPITNKVHIPSGQTRNLLGNEAQVVARQLVNEIMQREGKRLMLADPTARREVEVRIVRARRSVEDAIGAPQTVQSQIRNGVERLNEPQNEQEFAGLNTATTDDQPGAASGDATNTLERGAKTGKARA